MILDKNHQYGGAVAVAYSKMNDEDKVRTKAVIDVAKAMNAAISGVPVDFSAMEIPENAMPIQKIWNEITESGTSK